MAKDASFDITCDFDFQELRNAVDQAQKEARTRYDLKDADIEIELNDDSVVLTTENDMQLHAINGVLLQKAVNRKLSPKIFDVQDTETVGGGKRRQTLKLVRALDQENAKKITKMIRDAFPKVKPNIQGDTVRVVGKSRDDLQGVIALLRENDSLNLPLQFGNYR